MPRKNGNRGLNVTLPPDQLQQVHSLARLRGFKITSDYIRSLIETDARLAGVALMLPVDRGGYRGADLPSEE